jgi:hypothetical protein
MPVEKWNDTVQVHLGFGDVEVAHGLLTTEETIGCICFFNRKEPQPIGTLTEYPDNLEVEVEATPVRITFDKKESIDVMIRALQDAKTMMINKDLNRR